MCTLSTAWSPERLLAALPAKQSTRISVARVVGEFLIPNETDANGFVEYRNLCELGAFDTSGPLALADNLARVGAGEYRVTAYGFEPLFGGRCSCDRGRSRRDMRRSEPSLPTHSRGFRRRCRTLMRVACSVARVAIKRCFRFLHPRPTCRPSTRRRCASIKKRVSNARVSAVLAANAGW